MFKAHVTCHHHDWDFGGGADMADYVRGTLGATGITLIVAEAPFTRLRREPGGTLAIVRTAGGLAWRPRDRALAGTRCKPAATEHGPGQTPVTRLAERIRAAGLSLRVALSTGRLGQAAGHNPFAAVRNIVDDTSPRRVCLSNPDVVEMVAALVADAAARFAPDAIVLRDFDRGCRDEATGEITPARALGPVGDALLSLCACESCRQGAMRDDVDVEAAVRSARVALDRIVESGADTAMTVEDTIRSAPPLSAYAQWQSQALADGLAAIRKRIETPLLVHRNGREIEATAGLRELAAHAGVVMTHLHADGKNAGDTVDAVRAACGANAPVEVAFELFAGAGYPPQALVSDVKDAMSAGAAGVTIDDSMALTPPIADGVKQAIRYARRSL